MTEHRTGALRHRPHARGATAALLLPLLLVAPGAAASPRSPSSRREAPRATAPQPRGAGPAPSRARAATAPRSLRAGPPSSRARAAASQPRRSYREALTALRRAGQAGAARVLAQRVAQRQRKMRLTKDQARAAAVALLRLVPHWPGLRRLGRLMPRSQVELARSVAERGVPPAEAEAMASYLTGLATTLRCRNLRQLDRNHSHVTGRHWREIDYRNEGTTWQARRASWARYGVHDFRRARHLHRYFLHEETLPYFRRIYRPRGRMADVPAPQARAGRADDPDARPAARPSTRRR